jgi:hypothetical protein
MMISMSEQDWHALQNEIDPIVQTDPIDRLDETWHFPKTIAQGYQRTN